MKYLEQQNKAQQLLTTLAQKAWESTTFKEQLINNPIAAIEEATGKDLSKLNDKRIVVEDQTDESIIYLNIPAQPSIDNIQLTEEELETIAGGLSPTVAYVAGAALGIGICWLVDRYL